MSGFNNAQSNSWKEGDEVEIDIEQKGEYMNFKVPKAEDKTDGKLEQILNYLVGLKMDVAAIDAKLQAKARVVTEDNYPVNEEDVPF